MNYDRLLTRVWDKQKKKMFYPGDKHCFGKPNYPGLMKFIACSDSFMVCEFMAAKYKNGEVPANEFISFGDRFVPMLCLGRKNKDDKLLYQHDIVKTFENCLCTVEIDEGMSAFVFQLIGDENCKFCCTPLQVGRAEIIGNKWEQPEPWDETL